jgi:hypothetical protein
MAVVLTPSWAISSQNCDPDDRLQRPPSSGSSVDCFSYVQPDPGRAPAGNGGGSDRSVRALSHSSISSIGVSGRDGQFWVANNTTEHIWQDLARSGIPGVAGSFSRPLGSPSHRSQELAEDARRQRRPQSGKQNEDTRLRVSPHQSLKSELDSERHPFGVVAESVALLRDVPDTALKISDCLRPRFAL